MQIKLQDPLLLYIISLREIFLGFLSKSEIDIMQLFSSG